VAVWPITALVASMKLKPNLYASWFEAGSKLVGDQLRTSFEPASVMEFGFYSAPSQVGAEIGDLSRVYRLCI